MDFNPENLDRKVDQDILIAVETRFFNGHRLIPLKVSILVRPAAGGNAVLLNVPRSVAAKVRNTYF